MNSIGRNDRIEQAKDKIYADEKMKISDLKDQLDKKSTEDRERLQKQLELNQLQSEVYYFKTNSKTRNLTSPVAGRVWRLKHQLEIILVLVHLYFWSNQMQMKAN